MARACSVVALFVAASWLLLLAVLAAGIQVGGGADPVERWQWGHCQRRQHNQLCVRLRARDVASWLLAAA